MSKFAVREAAPEGGAIRGLTAELVADASEAIQDGLWRTAPLTEQSEKDVGAIKRYLAQEGWGCKVRTVKGEISWIVQEKKEITPEHKEKMLAALEASRVKRAAARDKADGMPGRDVPVPKSALQQPPSAGTPPVPAKATATAGKTA